MVALVHLFYYFYADCNFWLRYLNSVGSYSMLLILPWCQSVCNLIFKECTGKNGNMATMGCERNSSNGNFSLAYALMGLYCVKLRSIKGKSRSLLLVLFLLNGYKPYSVKISKASYIFP